MRLLRVTLELPPQHDRRGSSMLRISVEDTSRQDGPAVTQSTLTFDLGILSNREPLPLTFDCPLPDDASASLEVSARLSFHRDAGLREGDYITTVSAPTGPTTNTVHLTLAPIGPGA